MYSMDSDGEAVTERTDVPNLKQAVPFFGVASMDASVRYYREVTARGITVSKPFVGNGLWVTSLTDPDGYRIEFESPTDVPEDTVYSP
jgi:hypothetical protein